MPYDISPDEFNALTDCEKWAKHKHVYGVWLCPGCNDELDPPQRCQPIRGVSMLCSNCETVLTRRTNGGQSDTFFFKLSNGY